MQRYKRLMSIVLTIAMIMSMVPFSTISASAEDFSGAFFEPQGGYPEGYGPDYAQNQTETAADQTASASWSVGFTNPVSTPQSNTVSADAQDEAEDDTPRNDPDDDGRLRIRPVDGTLTLTIDGETAYENPAAKRMVFFITDDPYFFPNATPRKMAEYYRAIYPEFDMDRAMSMMEGLGLDPGRAIAGFSKGMKKQTALVLGICSGTRYLLCDETFDGLDPVMRQSAKSLIAQEIVDRAYLICAGQIVFSGTGEGLVNDENARKVYLGPSFNP